MGKLDGVTQTGCDLVAADGGEHPRLGVHSPVVLNLVADGKSINVKASVGNILREQRENGFRWIYRLEWDGTARAHRMLSELVPGIIGQKIMSATKLRTDGIRLRQTAPSYSLQ